MSDVLTGKNVDAKESSHPTIFHDILASDLPKEELSLHRLTQEAMSISGAGIETTMWTLSVATFHVLWNPKIYASLKAELDEAMPDPNYILPWAQLERLPYLTAVINEGELISSTKSYPLVLIRVLTSIASASFIVRLGAATSARQSLQLDELWILDNPGGCCREYGCISHAHES